MKSWAMGHRLCISNIEISKPWHKQWTVLGNLGRQRQIDYIIFDSTLEIIDSEVCNLLDISSDHRTVPQY